MATIDRFEDLDCWKAARKLTRAVYRVSSQGGFARDFGLRDQVRRASVSAMANVAEGFGRKGTKEFSQFLGIARASAAEVRSHLYVALDAGYIDRQTFDELAEKTHAVVALADGMIRYLKRVSHNGHRRKPATS